jgi:hypothetical protein
MSQKLGLQLIIQNLRQEGSVMREEKEVVQVKSNVQSVGTYNWAQQGGGGAKFGNR